MFATDNSNYTPFNAVGICARDFSTVFNDASIPGESYIVAIEAIYSLFVPASFSPDFQPQQQALMRSFGSLIDDAGAQKESIVLAKRKDRIFACRAFDYPGLLIHSTEPPAS